MKRSGDFTSPLDSVEGISHRHVTSRRRVYLAPWRCKIAAPQKVTMGLSLKARASPLAQTNEQLCILGQANGIRPFEEKMRTAGLAPLHATGITVFQINVGKLCNQTCHHCHVDAGPDRKEVMIKETAELCIRALAKTEIPNVDITGGAPELNPNFRWLVEQAVALGRHVMDRCNLSVLLLPSQADLANFLAQTRVEVIASLPYYREAQTDAQRGEGVFAKSISALRKLNELGYGQPGSGLVLNLVHNPVGAFLPPKQQPLEAQFRRELDDVTALHSTTSTPSPTCRSAAFWTFS